ncbi:MAG: biotin-dependent carboxyltransferase family protein [Roseivivax sp.]|nr:biotin-dependent carboxyltransferase family protein [Roseivivax sp.]
MSRALHVLACGPGLTVQDGGRPGRMAEGLSQGGALDRLALAEGAALLNQPPRTAALEMMLAGASFRAQGALRLAVTGATMTLTVDGVTLPGYTAHAVPDGATIVLGPARAGCAGYLHVDGGIDTAPLLGSRSVHTAAGLGAALAPGDVLPLGPAVPGPVDVMLRPDNRLGGGTLRVLPTYQSALFPAEEHERFAQTDFQRDPRGNRQGLRMTPSGAGFGSAAGLTVLSDVIVPGDVQVTGDGAPYVLMADCQTTGGYPRIATVLPCDMPRAAQAAPGATLRFAFVTLEQAVAAELAFRRHMASLPRQVTPRLRAPHDIADLLGYQLISGAVTGFEET